MSNNSEDSRREIEILQARVKKSRSLVNQSEIRMEDLMAESDTLEQLKQKISDRLPAKQPLQPPTLPPESNS